MLRTGGWSITEPFQSNVKPEKGAGKGVGVEKVAAATEDETETKTLAENSVNTTNHGQGIAKRRKIAVVGIGGK